MSNPKASLGLYKKIIDLLAGLHRGVHRLWVMERGWPKTEENKDINEFVESLSPAQKELLVCLLESAREGGIHDTLVVLNDRMALDGLRFVENGVEMAHQPFDSELYYDWTCRRFGDHWPDEEF